MTQAIKTTADTLASAGKALQELEAKLQRCREAMAAGTGHVNKIAELQRQRNEAEASAFLAGTSPNLAKHDEEISRLEKITADARNTARSAEVAIGILEPQIEAARAAVESCQEAHATAITEALREIFSAAESDYAEAAEALKVALSKMMAASALIRERTTAAPSGVVRGIVQSLTSQYPSGTGAAASNGFVTKGQNGFYEVDRELSVDGLVSRTTLAREEIRGQLQKYAARV
ncbi:MAG: hypothetical protein KGQ63_00115 [Betaproteobacteria bacterium]|nr:hypothetical protein [Betaproteobacteria bacterium]